MHRLNSGSSAPISQLGERRHNSLRRAPPLAGIHPPTRTDVDRRNADGATELQCAASEGIRATVESLLEVGADINAPPAEVCGRTALQGAAQNGREELVKFLLSKGAGVDALAASVGGRTALQAAAQGGHTNIVQLLLEKNADVNEPPSEKDGMTALQAAAAGGSVATARILIDAGADVNGAAAQVGGRTALQAAAAASAGGVDLVKLLLEHGANVNAPAAESRGMTALHAAASAGDKGIVELLLRNGAIINSQAREDGLTELQEAAGTGNIAVIDLLLKAGSDVNQAPALNSGRTALQAASGAGHIEAVGLLLGAGADINAPPAARFGFTALQSAASNGRTKVVELLLEKGANVNAPGARVGGLTALQAAAFAGDESIVKLLLSRDADVNARASEDGGRTALQAAASCGHAKIVKILVKAGADVNGSPASISGMTALQAALSGGHEDVVTLLIGYDAFSDTRVSDGTSLLHSAIVKGKMEVLKKLSSQGADMKQKDLIGRNCLHLISQYRYPEVMGWLLSQNLYDVNEHDYDGVTPLYLAAENGLLANIRRLLDAGANLDLEDNEGRTALRAALQNDRRDAVNLLLEKGAGITKLRVAHWRALLKSTETDIVVVTEKRSGGRSVEKHFMGENSLSKDYFEKNVSLLSERHLYCALGAKMAAEVVRPWRFIPGQRILQTLLHQTGPATVDWIWLPMHSKRKGAAAQPTLKIPTLEIIASIPPGKAILICYVRFEYFKTVPRGDSTFATKCAKSEISWIMVRVNTGDEPDTPGSHRPRSANSVPTAPKAVMLRSKDYFSALPYGWIPAHGMQFFTLFLEDLRAKWEAIFRDANAHLAKRRKVLLASKETSNLIDLLLEDAGKWDEFHTQLDCHVEEAQRMAAIFDEKEYLSGEVGDRQQVKVARSQLEDAINELRRTGAEGIKRLDEKTKEMISLEFNLTSIREAQESRVMAEKSHSMSLSMKRLSWITFIFLPLTFISSAFGMNVDVLQNNPPWFWYPAVGFPFLGLVLLAWVVFKYFNIEDWVEKHIGGALERLLSPRDKNRNQGLTGAFEGIRDAPGAPHTGFEFLPGVVLQGPDTAAMRQRQKMNRRRTRMRTFMGGLEPKRWLPGRGLAGKPDEDRGGKLVGN